MRVVEFNDYVQPNFALAQGALDANAFQHVVYLKNFAAKNKLELSELVKVPTAPIAIYSRKYKSVDAAPEGVSVAVPNDPTNQARALVVLQELGWTAARGLRPAAGVGEGRGRQSEEDQAHPVGGGSVAALAGGHRLFLRQRQFRAGVRAC